MIGQTLSHYRIVEKLGEGGMGEVYLAEDTSLKRRVALKVLSSELAGSQDRLDRFQTEAETLATLNHPNIVHVYSVEMDQGLHFLTMEFVEGGSLDQRIPRQGLPLEQFFDLALPLADALADAHEHGIVHRDLKPANVMVDRKGSPKIVDFGLAKLRQPDLEGNLSRLDTATMTQHGVILGTIPYMSPQQVQGLPVDHRTDLFSLGVLLYEMVSGRRPFEGSSAAAIAGALVRDTPVPASEIRPGLPQTLSDLLDSCLEKDPDERVMTAAEVRDVLRDLRAGATVTTMRPLIAAVRDRLWRSWPRRALVGAVAVTILMLAYVGPCRQHTVSEDALIASLVALPATVHGPESDAFLTDAIPSTLSTQLTRVEGVEIRLPPSSAEFLRSGGDVRSVAQAYRVDAVLLSTVTVQESLLSLDLQLVDAGTQTLLWSHAAERTREEYFGMIRQAADRLADVLQPKSRPGPPEPSSDESSPADLAIQRGVYHLNRYALVASPDDFDLAMTAFEQARALDRGRAETLALIALLYQEKVQAGAPAASIIPEIEIWAHRAIELDSGSSLAWHALYGAERYQLKPSHRLMLEYAFRTDSKSKFASTAVPQVMTFYSLVLGYEGWRQAIQIEPLGDWVRVNAALNLGLLGRREEGLVLVDEALQIEPDFLGALLTKPLILAGLGRIGEAQELITSVPSMPDTYRVFAEHVKLILAIETGDLDSVNARLPAQLAWAFHPEFPFTFRWPYLMPPLIDAFTRHGDFENALDVMIQLHEAGLGDPPYDWLRLSPAFDPIRDDPRFRAVEDHARENFDLMLEHLARVHDRGLLPSELERERFRLMEQLEN